MLTELQQQLNRTYQLPADNDVRPFLITSAETAEQIAPGALSTGSRETLLLAEGDGELAVSLFLDEALLTRLEAEQPLSKLKPSALADLWLVLEGLSHFNTVAHRAACDRAFSLLELELQAEIDKYVASVQLAMAQDDPALAKRIHYWLFENLHFHEELSAAELERYKAANRYAARFCHALGRELTDHASCDYSGLQRFFRLPIADKISVINAQ